MPWSDSVTFLIAAAAACLVSLLVTAGARNYALRRGMIDQPGARRSHTQPTPRGGGIGIAIACLLACLYLAWRDGASWAFVALGLVLVAAVGWWDDHRALSALSRLLAHVLAGICLAVGMALHGAGTMGALLALLAVPVLVNVWNFMDGIDGLAASQAALCAAALTLLVAGGWGLLAVVLCAACVGFLPFNLPRARIFLGDVGSGALGYVLAALVVAGLQELPFADWPLVLLPLSAFLVDAALTLLWRIRRGEAWWQPHVQHLYQQASRRHGHLRVSAAYAGWTLAAIALMLVSFTWSDVLAMLAALGWMVTAALLWCWRHHGDEGKSEGFGS